MSKIQFTEQALFNDLSALIEQSKNFVVVQANSVMTMLFWNVGIICKKYVLLCSALKILAKKIEPKVYEYGFLKE